MVEWVRKQKMGWSWEEDSKRLNSIFSCQTDGNLLLFILIQHSVKHCWQEKNDLELPPNNIFLSYAIARPTLPLPVISTHGLTPPLYSLRYLSTSPIVWSFQNKRYWEEDLKISSAANLWQLIIFYKHLVTVDRRKLTSNCYKITYNQCSSLPVISTHPWIFLSFCPVIPNPSKFQQEIAFSHGGYTCPNKKRWFMYQQNMWWNEARLNISSIRHMWEDKEDLKCTINLKMNFCQLINFYLFILLIYHI